MSNKDYDVVGLLKELNKGLKPRNEKTYIEVNNDTVVPKQKTTQTYPAKQPATQAQPQQPVKPKYILTNDTISFEGRKLHRIQALIDIPSIGVEAGDLGGYIEEESNLKHNGTCWVFDDAKVYGLTIIKDGATVRGNASVGGNQYGYVIMKDTAAVYDNAKVYGNVTLAGSSKIYDHAEVYSERKPSSYSKGGVRVYGSACVCGYAKVKDASSIYGNAYISGNVTIRCAVQVGAWSRLEYGVYSDGKIERNGLGSFATHEEI